MKQNSSKLTRKMGLLTLTATGVCSMLGASINVVPFMIQRNVPGIGPYVLPAFAFAALPALFAALAYANLSSAMPRAGGSYLYASRGLHPYLGFIASFSQWFGLSIVIGVIAYVCVPFMRDVALALDWMETANRLEQPLIRVSLALFLIWIFIYVNIRGTRSYEKILLPMMFLMFILGGIVIVAGFYFDSETFLKTVATRDGLQFEVQENVPFDWRVFLSGAALLFSSFIGFDSIAQAGSEAKNPTSLLPKAIFLAILSVGLFYFLFTAAVYNTVPWSYVYDQALQKDISAPGLLSYVLPAGLGVAILCGAAIALINDLPAMLLSVSRLMFAWAEDGIFPSRVARVHPRFHTPHVALVAAGCMASIGALGSHFASDFFLGIDIMVTSMMVNFLLMCITLLTIPKVNPELAEKMVVIKSKSLQRFVGITGTVLLVGFLIIHIYKDLRAEVDAWYFHSTPIFLIVTTLASLLFWYKWKGIGRKSKNGYLKFKMLPNE